MSLAEEVEQLPGSEREPKRPSECPWHRELQTWAMGARAWPSRRFFMPTRGLHETLVHSSDKGISAIALSVLEAELPFCADVLSVYDRIS
jgi:hypothetical protein